MVLGRPKIVLAITIIVFLIGLSLQVEAATITVCSAGYGTCDYTTIQAAINNANPGDVINVTGTFNENMNLGKSIILQSNDTLESNITGTLILETGSSNSVIRRFNMSGGSAIGCNVCAGSEAANLTKICDNTGETSNITYEYLNISGNGSICALEIQSRENTIRYNRIFGNGFGIIFGSKPATKNKIYGNNFTGNYIAIRRYAQVGVPSVDGTNISGNYFEGNGTSAIGFIDLESGGSAANFYIEYNNFTRATVNSSNFVVKTTIILISQAFTLLTINNNVYRDIYCADASYLNFLSNPVTFSNNILANISGNCQRLTHTTTGSASYMDNVFYNFTGIGTWAQGNLINISNNTYYNSSNISIYFSDGVATMYKNKIYNISGKNGTIIVANKGNTTATQNNITASFLAIEVTSDAGSTNKIYNNYFNSTWNAKTNIAVEWNTSKIAGTNIMGGNFIAGNFWSDYNGVDNDGDGIGDTNLPYNSSGNISTGGDYAPLVVAAAGAANSLPTISINAPQNNSVLVSSYPNITVRVIDNEQSTTYVEIFANNSNKSYALLQNNTLTNLTWAQTADGIYTYFARAYDNSSNNVSESNLTITIDTTSPSSITNLRDTANSTTWILWNWTNPNDADFNHTEVYLNGTFKTNTSSEFYNATALAQNTGYEIQVRTVDNLGNIGSWTNDTAFTLDIANTLPSIQIISPANNTETKDNTPSITFKFIDAENATVQATLYFNKTNVSYNNAVANNTNTILTASALAGGNWTFWINVSDGAGENTSLRFDIGIDSTKPTISIATPTDINTSVSRNWTYFNITLDEAGNSANVEVNKTNYTLTQGTTGKEWYKNFTNQNVGNYTYRFFANDTFGNTGFTGFSWVNLSWSPTDTTPPAAVTNLKDTLNSTTWILWNWTNPSDSDFNHTEIYLNGTFKTNTSSEFYNATALSQNTGYEIQVRTVDNTGNIGSWTNDTAFTLAQDTTPPTISFVSPSLNNESKSQNWIYINVTLSESGSSANLELNKTNYSMSQGTTNTEFYLNKTNLADGNHTFKVYANDTAGNTGKSEERWVNLDTTSPAGITNLRDTLNGTTWILWNWTNPNDSDFNHVEVYLDSTFKTNSSSNSYNATGISANASYELEVRPVDNLGNIGNWVNDTASTLPLPDTTPPAEITNLNESTKTINSITWNWTNPADADFNHVEVYLNGTFKTNTSSEFYNATGLNANTGYEIQTRPVDNLGNIGSWTNDTAQTNADSVTPPVIGTAGGGGGGGGGAGPALPQESTSIGNLAAGEDKIITFQNSESHYINTISLTAKSEVKNGNVRVTRYYTRPGAVSDISDSVFTYISIEPINFKTEDISTAEIQFFANKSFVDKNSGKEIVLLHYNGKSWEDLTTIKTGAYDDKLTYKAKTPGFSFFAISVAEKIKQAQLAAPETLVPAEAETVKVETPKSTANIVPVAPSAVTGLVIFDRIKNPYSLALIGGLLFAGLIGYTFYSGKVKLPQISVRKIEKPKFEILKKLKEVRLPNFSLPKIKLVPKAQSSQPIAKKFELPKLSLPKLSLPKLRIEKRAEPQAETQKFEKPVINVVVKPPQIDYKKLAKELRPIVEPKPKEEKKIEEKITAQQPAFPALAKPYVAQPLQVNTHMKSVLAALHEREREVMETLILHSGRTTMARVFHHTGMPPTTLFRWIVSLENRGLIKSTKIGKLRRIEVTGKFLGNENKK